MVTGEAQSTWGITLNLQLLVDISVWVFMRQEMIRYSCTVPCLLWRHVFLKTLVATSVISIEGNTAVHYYVWRLNC